MNKKVLEQIKLFENTYEEKGFSQFKQKQHKRHDLIILQAIKTGETHLVIWEVNFKTGDLMREYWTNSEVITERSETNTHQVEIIFKINDKVKFEFYYKKQKGRIIETNDLFSTIERDDGGGIFQINNIDIELA